MRTKESRRFLNYWNYLQDEAKKRGKIYFCDSGEGKDFESAEQDMIGYRVGRRDARCPVNVRARKPACPLAGFIAQSGSDRELVLPVRLFFLYIRNIRRYRAFLSSLYLKFYRLYANDCRGAGIR